MWPPPSSTLFPYTTLFRSIELVVVNLYPFKKIAADPDVTPAIATENIDIGGPTMIRAGAKNYAHVALLTDPEQYTAFMEEYRKEASVSFASRQSFARAAFQHTADYDAAI